MSVHIDDARATDMDFVRDSWRQSYRRSPRTARWASEPYSIFIADTMDRLLPRCRIVVTRPPDWPAGILGWLAAEQTPGRFCVHYTFVKPLFRRQGVMTALIKHLEPRGELVFSHLRPPFTAALKQHGFTWKPTCAEPTGSDHKHG